MLSSPTTPHTSRALLAGAALLCALSCLPATALAYQQTLTCYPSGIFACREGETPIPVSWNRRCISYVVNQAGATGFAPEADGSLSMELLEAIQSSFRPWTVQDCAQLALRFDGITDRTDVGYDRDKGDQNQNLIIWQSQWPYASGSAYALTSVTFSLKTGIISDADMEMNQDNFRFTNTDLESTTAVDVKNTMTHEVGHFIGLDHSKNQTATMFDTAPEGELQKRSLEQDDIEGLCDIYPPIATIPEGKGVCDVLPGELSNASAQGDDGCHVAPLGAPASPAPFGAGLVALALGGLVVRRRRSSCE